MQESMLSTVDNPFSPFTQYDQWYAFDERKGYDSTRILARIVNTSDELSETDQSIAIEDAIDEIVLENVSGMHRKVTPEDFV